MDRQGGPAVSHNVYGTARGSGSAAHFGRGRNRFTASSRRVSKEMIMESEISNEESRNSNAHERIERTKTNFKEGTHSAVSGAKEKFGSAADKVESGLDRAAEATARGAHRATEKATEWRDRGSDLASGARDRAEDALDNVRDFVREKPVQSVAIALAAGWLIGRLTHSRH